MVLCFILNAITTIFSSFLHQLLRKNPERRLGSSQRDAEDIKKQPFYKDMKWDSLLHRKLKAPFIPTVKHAEDVSNFDVEFTSEDPVLTPPRERKNLSTNDQVLYFNFFVVFIRLDTKYLESLLRVLLCIFLNSVKRCEET